MKHYLPAAGFALLICAMVHAQGPAITSYVDPFIGTDGMGHTFPGACVPFGGVQLSPDTDTIPHNINGKYQPMVYETCAGYRYSDPTIVGFSHTHFSGTGHSDLGDILIMPTTGPLKLNPGTAGNPDSGFRSRFSHDSEKAETGYYEVTLKDYGIKARLTATQRVGVHQYTFPAAGMPGQAGHDGTVTPGQDPAVTPGSDREPQSCLSGYADWGICVPLQRVSQKLNLSIF